MDTETTIPLFPLGVVLLPAMILPLHIFEERYKLMIDECLEEKREFGIVYSDQKEIRKKGCMAQIVQVLKRYDDGRMDILTRGVKRFFIEEIIDEKPYLQARVAYFDDEVELESEELAVLVKDGIKLLQELDSLIGKKTDYKAVSKLEPKVISFLLAYNDEFTPAERQEFLSMTSTRQRLIESSDALRKMIERYKKELVIKKIVGGNGNLRKRIAKSSAKKILETE
ncbi:MAG: LON peptidase substrate-binding domain-containing protein [Syntrophobacterales bacterium]|jgi:Lon protease-like protein